MNVLDRLITEVNQGLQMIDYARKNIVNNLGPVLNELYAYINSLEQENAELRKQLEALGVKVEDKQYLQENIKIG